MTFDPSDGHRDRRGDARWRATRTPPIHAIRARDAQRDRTRLRRGVLSTYVGKTLWHEEALVVHPSLGSIGIDKQLVPLIYALWRLGAQTTGCCEDAGSYAEHGDQASSGQAHIDFVTRADARDFAHFVNRDGRAAAVIHTCTRTMTCVAFDTEQIPELARELHLP